MIRTTTRLVLFVVLWSAASLAHAQHLAPKLDAKPKMMRIPLKPVEILMLTKDKPLEFQPGEKWKYDNSGYIFLGVIVKKVSGEKYAEYLKKHIFGVLDMQDSGYDDSNIILKNR